MRRWLLLGMLALAGCGDDDEGTPGPSAGEEREPPPVEPEPAPEPPAPSADPIAGRRERAEAADPSQVREFRRKLAEARRLHREKNDVEAIARYREAAALDTNGRAFCELGWIFFLREDLDRAEENLERGLALLPADDPVPERFVGPVGSCLYNLGRLEEEREHPEAARRYYERSLEVRPGNRIVERRLAALPAAPGAEPSGRAVPRCGSGSSAFDVSAWRTRAGALSGAPERFDALFEELGFEPIREEAILRWDGSRVEDPQLEATARVIELSLGERRGQALHLHVGDDTGNGFDRVAVLLEAQDGERCVAGTLEQDQDMCSTACLGEDTPMVLSTERLVAPDVDALRVVRNGGACACGTLRGAVSETAFYGIEGDALVRYLAAVTYDAFYTSPVPPSGWTEAQIEVEGDHPRTIRVVSREACAPGCDEQSLAAAEARIEAAESDEEAQEIRWELESECGFDPEPCTPSETTTTYVYRDGDYVER